MQSAISLRLDIGVGISKYYSEKKRVANLNGPKRTMTALSTKTGKAQCGHAMDAKTIGMMFREMLAEIESSDGGKDAVRDLKASFARVLEIADAKMPKYTKRIIKELMREGLGF